MAKVYCVALVATLVVIASFYGADAISCYAGAGTAFALTPGCTQCVKTVGQASGLPDAVVKSCAASCSTGSATVGPLTTTTYCCAAESCNGAGSVRVNLLAAFLTSLLAALYMRC